MGAAVLFSAEKLNTAVEFGLHGQDCEVSYALELYLNKKKEFRNLLRRMF